MTYLFNVQCNLLQFYGFINITNNVNEKSVRQLFTTQSQLLTTVRKKTLENIVRKGENAGNKDFLLFPQCFLPYLRQKNRYFSNI